MSRINHTVSAVGAAAVIAAFLIVFAGDGIQAYFTPDDMMNLYQAWFRPLLEADRPLGNLVYRGLFQAFGLNPLPYRIACFLLLFINLVLLYFFARRVSGSPEVGALACLLGAYHAHLADLYYSSGTIYDLLCASLYFGAFLLYTRGRAAGAVPAWRTQALVWGLFLMALLAKEMALTLPALLLAFDLLYDPPKRSPAAVRMWILREARLLAVPMLLALGVAAWKVTGPRRMIENPAYRPEFTARAFFDAWRHYASDLFYGVSFTSAGVVALLAATLLAGLLWRKRELLLAWIVMAVGLLPVSFITPRGFFVIYLTLPGWYLFAAVVLHDLSAAAWRGSALRPVVVFALLTAVLIPLHYRQKPIGNSWVAEAHAAVRNVEARLDRVAGRLPHGARVLFLADPYPLEDWILTFIFRLHYRDDQIQVDRVRTMKEPPPPETIAGYARVFRIDSGVLRAQ